MAMAQGQPQSQEDGGPRRVGSAAALGLVVVVEAGGTRESKPRDRKWIPSTRLGPLVKTGRPSPWRSSTFSPFPAH